MQSEIISLIVSVRSASAGPHSVTFLMGLPQNQQYISYTSTGHKERSVDHQWLCYVMKAPN